MLRDFSWSYFASTGDIHAYLLFREHPASIGDLSDESEESAPCNTGDSTACL
ncbi:YqzL family protein [Brevibacillus sp. SYSU BS000544]|uniref:YqzL family protein n=1 Tax=Brevibacillus sp. SYSU BS000544 TaxID=3416443 RepID=UPI003CE4AD2F